MHTVWITTNHPHSTIEWSFPVFRVPWATRCALHPGLYYDAPAGLGFPKPRRGVTFYPGASAPRGVPGASGVHRYQPLT